MGMKRVTPVLKKHFITSSQVLHYFTVKASEVNPMGKKNKNKKMFKNKHIPKLTNITKSV